MFIDFNYQKPVGSRIPLVESLESQGGIVMFIVFNYQRPIGSRIPLVEPLGREVSYKIFFN